MSTADPSARRRGVRIDERFVAPFLVTAILLAGNAGAGILKSPLRLAAAIGTALVVEAGAGWLVNRRVPHLASAYISGISVGILIQANDVWPYALCAALSILSKYVLRFRGRHLWNPSNFGICAMLLIAREYVATLSVEFGNQVWAMLVIWLLGCVILHRIRRLHITLAYVASFAVTACLRSWLQHHPVLAELSPITGPMYQLFIFFMITDPKTTIPGTARQVAVVVLVAVAETAFRLAGNPQAPFFALFVVGPLAMLWDLARKAPARSSAVEGATA